MVESKHITNVGLFIVILAQVSLTYLSIQSSNIMMDEWEDIFLNKSGVRAKAHVDPFWGPVNVLIPATCGEVYWNSRQASPSHVNTTSASDDPLVAGAVGGVSAPSSEDPLPHGPLADMKVEILSKGSSDDPYVKVEICNYTRPFGMVRFYNRYLSMIDLTERLDFLGLLPDPKRLEDWANLRLWFYEWAKLALLATMGAKYALKVIDILTDCCGHKYYSLWTNGRTTFDVALESLMLQGMGTVFILTMQMSLCLMFFVIWDEDHFLTIFMPLLGFEIFIFSLGVVAAYMLIDRLCGLMTRCSNRYIWMFWIVYCVWLFLVATPMIGYCIYSLDFALKSEHWLTDEDLTNMYSKEFRDAAAKVLNCVGAFAIVGILDVVVIVCGDVQRTRLEHTTDLTDAIAKGWEKNGRDIALALAE